MNFVWVALWHVFYPVGGPFAIWLYSWVQRWPGIAIYYMANPGVPIFAAYLVGFPFSVWDKKTPLLYKTLGAIVCVSAFFVALVVFGITDLFFGCAIFGGSDCNPIGY